MPKHLILAASLPAPPQKLFDMYLDSAAHAAFTGAPVSIESAREPPFVAFDGKRGTILHIEPKQLIVQTWRSVNWADGDIDSVLVLSFWPEENGRRIGAGAQINVSDKDFAGVSHGWEKYYWTPWRAYLIDGSRS